MKLLIRQILSAFLYYTGLNYLFRAFFRRHQIVVLMYHRVLDRKDLYNTYIQPGMYVRKDIFEMQMQYLANVYKLVSFDELIDCIQRGDRFQSNTCLITFDDGWKDFYAHAFPILRRYHLPATVFLVSAYIGTNEWFWPEKISYLLTHYFKAPTLLEPLSTYYPSLIRLGIVDLIADARLTPGERIEAVIEALKSPEEQARVEAIYELEQLLKDCYVPATTEPLLLSWDEISGMSRFQISFGSHTRTHAILTKLPRNMAQQEISQSKEEIEAQLSGKCSAFCYPNGLYDEEIKQLVKECYTCAFSTEEGFVKQGDDFFTLKRIAIHDDITYTKAMFACRISGILNALGL